MTVAQLTQSVYQRMPPLVAFAGAFMFLVNGPPADAQAITPVPGTTTRDIAFTSHDGYPMLGD